MELVQEAVLRAELGTTHVAGAGPLGMRMIIDVVGGTVTGERLNGSLVGAGADWLAVGADGFGRVDVRAQLKTDDGAVIYVTYEGLLELNEATMAASTSDATTDFGDQYFRIAARMETGDERYAWVNTTLFVGRGRMHETGVEYELFRVA